MDVDIVCVGFGPAMGGFLTTLSNGTPPSRVPSMPGCRCRWICYERADDIAFGVSGAVTRARGIRASLARSRSARSRWRARWWTKRCVYLLDPVGASRRSRAAHGGSRIGARAALARISTTPSNCRTRRRSCARMADCSSPSASSMQWVGSQLMGSGAVQIWPGMPVAGPLIEGASAFAGVGRRYGCPRRADGGGRWAGGRGRPAAGRTASAFPPGIIRANGRGHEDGGRSAGARASWRRARCSTPSAIPEPEIFGFFYVHPERVASVGIFVPSWFRARCGPYRYLQHYMSIPICGAIWRAARCVPGARNRWQESGRRGEPYLAGDGWARIGEGSGSTNVLTGSGVDEAWTTGTQLAEGVVELMKEGRRSRARTWSGPT
jgi:electron-transferring-flavoprotein dehydrogenase